jgi:S-adenosylmethionine-dependent methyltransferase
MIARAWRSFKSRRQLGRDADFDECAIAREEFYGSSAGEVRLAVLVDDMLANIPGLEGGGLRVLDAGAGSGRMAIRLAQLGHQVVLSDPSRTMLDQAEAAIQRAELEDAITVIHAPIQNLEATLDGRFDVITCHAVLNWLAEPKAALAQLVRWLEPDGRLSLLFANKIAGTLQQILRGDFERALRLHQLHEGQALYGGRLRLSRFTRLPSGWSRLGWGHASPMPLSEQVVRTWLDDLGLVVQSKAGIRIFHDYLPKRAGSPDQLSELIAIENEFRNTEPFASLGQLIHLVCARSR